MTDATASDARALRDPSTGVPLTPAMAARYGARRTPRAALAALVVLCVVFVGGVLVLGWVLATPPVQVKLLAFRVVSDTRVDVTFEVRRDTTSPTVCILRAQGTDHTDVGYAEVTITPGRDYVQPTYPLATYARATTAEVLGCAAGAAPRVDPPGFLPGTTNPAQQPTVDGS